MRRLVFRTQARLEYVEAVRWYRDRDLQVAIKFVEVVERNLQTIQEKPFQYQAIEDGFLRATLRQFPYLIVYQVKTTEIIINSFFHTSRNPVSLRGQSS
ncbi:MAG: type II toxin-antitoxin system RelE/ParE family toxin [Pseudolabrys sp.]|nr:type II toxin-antitoxin system RelE/ParE family toxin [Pseudolabrys sp.]